MATYNYLDKTGLGQVWAKIKQYVNTIISNFQSDWNASEGEEGHVLNRPMWLDLYDNTIFSSEEPTAFVIPSGGSIEVTPIKNYFYNLLHSGGQVTIVTDNGTITSALGHDPINNYYYCDLDTSDFFLSLTEDKVELIGRLGASGTYNISEIRVPYHEVMVKEEYNSVFQADWAEADPSYGDYIKNKPPVRPGTGVNSLIIGATSNQVTGDASIANGINNNVSGHYSIVNGDSNLASQGTYEIINGYDNTTSGYFAVANGQYNKASKAYSLAHGNYSEASATHAIAIGSRAKASGVYSFAFGTNSQLATLNLTGEASATTYSTTVNDQNTADTLKRLAPSLYITSSSGSPIRVTSIVDGNQSLELLITFESTLSTTSISQASYVFNRATATTGDVSVAMGLSNLATNQTSIALGANNVSSGVASFAEGKSNISSNNQSHAEGYLTVSSSNQSHAEGRGTTASALAAHSEGHGTTASGEASHSENKSTVASGKYTHAQGENTTANGYAETAIGRYNTLSTANAQTAYNTTNSPYILVAGNGTADNARSNAHTLDWSGNGWYAGKLTVGTNPTADMDVVTKKYVDDSGFMTGMIILSYGISTWADFIDAYTNKRVVYCRASSAANPATGSQTRLAFMAYVNVADNPTEVEFQYYRSVSSHSNNQQGDQVYVYKLNKTGGWSVTVRECYTKVVAGTGLTGNWASGAITLGLSSSIPVGSTATPQPLGVASAGSSSDFSKADHVHALPTLSISSNVITLTGASGQTTSITLPVYNGGVSSS